VQWDAADFESIGFSYKPVTPDVKDALDNLQSNPEKKKNDDAVNEIMQGC